MESVGGFFCCCAGRGCYRDAVGFDQGVESKRGSRFALAPCAMAAVDEERGGFHAVADFSARASAGERVDGGIDVGGGGRGHCEGKKVPKGVRFRVFF